MHYVNVNSSAPLAPYVSWATAATNIQDAVDASAAGDEVIVTNGVYSNGGRAVYGQQTNRVAVDRPVTLLSVNGPQVTIIEGVSAGSGIRCVYLTANALLSGFTLTNGAMFSFTGTNDYEASGGGVWCSSLSAVITNCILTGNSAAASGGGSLGGSLFKCVLTSNNASGSGPTSGGGGGAANATLIDCVVATNSGFEGGGLNGCGVSRCLIVGNSGTYGGGCEYGTLNNCLLLGNFAGVGGGASLATLNNCTLVGNSATDCGGEYNGFLTNCIIYFNTSTNGTNWCPYGSLDHCCTTPLPPPVAGTGNITSDPLFLDLAGGNFHLQSNSPCINAGANTYMVASTDLDGHPRIIGGTVDIGAYEFVPSPSMRIARMTTNITLAWPLWASNFVAQEAAGFPLTSAAWSNVSAIPIQTPNENVVTVPDTNVAKFFRLFLPRK